MPRPLSLPPKSGFTLVELAVVLVVIGLLIGSILAGSTLIKVAELRKIFRQYESFVLATSTFKIKYNCLPGDCPDATDLFGTDPEGCGAWVYNKTPKTETCDGTGDGLIDRDAFNMNPTISTIQLRETFTFWQHLGSAGMIPGIYEGSYHNASPHLRTNATCPSIASTTYCWVPTNTTSQRSDDLKIFAAYPKNVNVLYMSNPEWGFDYNTYFTPSEALQYDTKFDDGSPVSGTIYAQSITWGGPNCTTTQDAAAAYDLSYTTPQCGLYQILPFN